MKWTQNICMLYVLLNVIFILPSCENLITTNTPNALTVNPTQLTLPVPTIGQSTSQMSIFVTNTGSSDLTINSIQFKETDNVNELVLALGEDWSQSSSYILQGQESRELVVVWSPLDTEIDQATITFKTEDQEIKVDVETSPIRRELIVSTDPDGVSIGADGADGGSENPNTLSGQSITVETAPSSSEHVSITLAPTSPVPVELRTICFSDADGQCLTQADPNFRLCSEADSSLEQCTVFAWPDITRIDQSKTFSILFAPMNTGERIAYVSIQSNAQNTANYLLQIIGKSCVQQEGQTVCGSCGDGIVNAELGEACDDGNTDETDDCLSTCQLSCHATDSCDPLDSDEDGVSDENDNCVSIANPDQSDCDMDGVGDVCDEDPCIPVNEDDQDGDMIADQQDNCREVANADQSDRDQDGIGDACDAEADTPNLVLEAGNLSPSSEDHVSDELRLSGKIVSGFHASTTPNFKLVGVVEP